MFLTLLKKQFIEIFKGYFVDQKTGKARSKKSSILYFALFIFVLISLGSAFFGLSYAIGIIFIDTNIEWLYFGLIGLITIMVGTFGSVLSTHSILYQAKDNEFLLSLPIKSKYIVLSRIAVVYLLSFVYGSMGWIPGIIAYIVIKGTILLPLIYQIVLTFIIALLVSTLTCVLGYIVAIISNKIKNKNITRVILTLVLLGGYYGICFNTQGIITAITNNGEKISAIVKTWAQLIYLLGKGAIGDSISLLLLFILICIGLFGICLYLLSRSFIRIVTANKTFKTVNKKEKIDALTIDKTLLKKETKRFLGSSLYVLNGGLGMIFAIAIGVICLINVDKMLSSLTQMEVSMETIFTYAPLIIAIAISLMLGMDVISTPSMSLEGNTLWILKSLPIEPYKIFIAKEKLHFIPNAIAGVISTILMGIGFKLNILDIICVIIFVLLFVGLTDSFGLMIGIKKANFTWTNESYPIKQSINILYSLLFSWGTSIISGVLCYELRDILNISLTLILLSLIFGIFIYLINKWLKNKGTQIFNEY